MSYQRLTVYEREGILKLSTKGLTIRGTTLKLRRSPSSVSKELKRLYECALNLRQYR